MRILLEHVTVTSSEQDSLHLHIDCVELPSGADPVSTGFSLHPDALSHSTSWRAENDTLILTFIHVLKDATPLETTWVGTPEELESLPSACHAVRHLHFLRFTDDDIAAWSGIEGFWGLAQQVADHHYPAVAGLLFQHGLADGPDFVI